jgi:hypothetical protein
LRLSLYGKDLASAVDGILHLFRHDWAAHYAFNPESLVEMDIFDVPLWTLSSSMKERFAEAQRAYVRAFGRWENGAIPRQDALRILADLTNTIGLNFGSR